MPARRAVMTLRCRLSTTHEQTEADATAELLLSRSLNQEPDPHPR